MVTINGFKFIIMSEENSDIEPQDKLLFINKPATSLTTSTTNANSCGQQAYLGTNAEDLVSTSFVNAPKHSGNKGSVLDMLWAPNNLELERGYTVTNAVKQEGVTCEENGAPYQIYVGDLTII